MTVCVAAICDGGSYVVGAADRMLTAGDIEFEPQQAKIWQLTRSVGVLVAGDSAIQTEVLRAVEAVVNQRIQEQPENWWMLHDVADLYREHYNKLRLKRAESRLLAPLGLDAGSFIRRQRELEPSLAQQLAAELTNFRLSPTGAIIFGADPTGVHIFVANGGETTCQDAIGFAAIGAGTWHASSQLMFAGHTRAHKLAGTMFLVYAAKRRAEVAPGVGGGTDMFWFARQLGLSGSFPDEIIAGLEKEYKRERARAAKAATKAEESFAGFLAKLAGAKPGAQQEPPEGTTPSN